MPDFRDNPGVYVTNGGSPINHTTPYRAHAALCGIALKQRAPAADAALSAATVIAAGESMYLKDKGECRIKLSDHAAITVATKGAAVYITAAHALTSVSTGNSLFGRVVETSGERGLPSGSIRIDMSRKV